MTTLPMTYIRVVTLAASALLPTQSGAAAPGRLPHVDHDHIAYARPYGNAVALARQRGRILIVRPFPIGGVPDGSRDGRWCPLADYMRAVTLSDETVVTLINRRFVFTYFSLVDWSELSDAQAKAAIVRVAPEYGASTRQTPPTFFFSPDGRVLATLDTMEPAEAFVRVAKRLLAEHPEYDRPSREETELARNAARDPRSRLVLARLRLELADVEEAKSILDTLIPETSGIADAVRAEAFYLLGQRARLEGDVARAERYFASLERLPRRAWDFLALDVRMERAHLQATAGDWEGGLRAWSAIEADVPTFDRKAELLYAKALGYYHLGKRREANATWVRVLEEVPEGRYYQRARLAAMGPTYSPVSPDLALPGRKALRHFTTAADPSRLPGSTLGYGRSSDGRVGTDETPERFLKRAYRDYATWQRMQTARSR